MTSRSSLVDRVLGRSVEVGDCLEWQGAMQSAGCTPVMNWHGKPTAVRRLIAEALEMRIDGMVVTNRCGNLRCVAPEHLLVTTRNALSKKVCRTLDRSSVLFRANMQRRVIQQARVKLSLEKAAEIRARYAEGGVTQRALAAEYGVTQYAIGCVVNGRTWNDFSSPFAQLLR